MSDDRREKGRFLVPSANGRGRVEGSPAPQAGELLVVGGNHAHHLLLLLRPVVVVIVSGRVLAVVGGVGLLLGGGDVLAHCLLHGGVHVRAEVVTVACTAVR